MSQPLQKGMDQGSESGGSQSQKNNPDAMVARVSEDVTGDNDNATSSASPVEELKKLFVEAAKSDDAMNKAFAALVESCQNTEKYSLNTLRLMNALIVRLANAGVIRLTKDEWIAFGLKPKAAEIRATVAK